MSFWLCFISFFFMSIAACLMNKNKNKAMFVLSGVSMLFIVGALMAFV